MNGFPFTNLDAENISLSLSGLGDLGELFKAGTVRDSRRVTCLSPFLSPISTPWGKGVKPDGDQGLALVEDLLDFVTELGRDVVDRLQTLSDEGSIDLSHLRRSPFLSQ